MKEQVSSLVAERLHTCLAMRDRVLYGSLFIIYRNGIATKLNKLFLQDILRQ